jgi:serine/threonine-protein kinase
MDTDRNLLFGILALQADFIDNSQFARACGQWAADKDRHLADILVECGWLKPQDRSLVVLLVQRKLQKHEGDAQASLAEVTSDRVRQSLASLADTGIHQSLAYTPPAPPAHVVPATTESVPQSRERYTQLRLHATGGIGRIWLARDASLGRDVALKELRPERASNPAVWARFLREAQVTGQLEHPGIVPIYEVGRRHEDQQPFYTMRFVRGLTLAEAVAAFHQRKARGEAGPLELRELLAAFVGVCNAVAYAHSRGVLHRDLKPSNVVLGGYGEVMVLDWGLAKLMGEPDVEAAPLQVAADEEGHATQQGQVLGTPAYMAPEQAEGRLDLLGPASDVYGLGAILYEILTGRPPFTGTDTIGLLRRVVHEVPARPRSLQKESPAALEGVCLKALAKKPAGRYESAAELAREVVRYLADEPVHAYPARLPERAVRWARKHRAASVAAAAILAVTAAAAAGVAILVAFSRAEIKKQRDTADANYARAEENFQLARQAVQDYLTRVSENKLLKTQDRQDLRELRKELLEDALRFYQKFIEQRGDHPQQRAELADAYQKVADITTEIGSTTDALRHAQQALLLREALAQAEPEDAQAQQHLAETLLIVGSLQRETGEFASALESFQRVRDLYQKLVGAHPENLQSRRQLALSFNRIATLSHDSSRPHEALQAYQKALEIMEQLTKEKPEDIKFRNLLGTIVNNIGLLQQQLRQDREALRSYERAAHIFESLAKDEADEPRWRNLFAAALNDIGCLAADLGDRTEGRRRLREALALHLEVVRRHPTVLAFQDDLARTYMNLGDLERTAGDPAAALPLMHQCLEIRAKLARDNPKVFWFQSQWAATYLNIGTAQTESGDLDGAAASFQQGIAIEAPLVAANPDKPKLASTLGRTHYRLGLVRLKQNRRPEAHSALSLAVEQHRLAFEKSSQVSEFREYLSDDYHALADLHRETRQATEALKLLRACRPLWAGNATELYRVAAGMARCGGQDDALAVLKEAVAAGYDNVSQLGAASALDPLRNRADFQQIVKDLEAKQKAKVP